MSGDRWIVIPKWDEFQHYKDRDPKWIKVYTRLLANPDYVGLSFPQRGLLHGIWHLYARSAQDVPDNTAYLSRQLGGKVLRKSLEALNHAGWITFSASKPLAPRYQPASPEVEKEKERALSADAHETKTEGATFAAHVIAHSGREHRPYDPPTNAAATIRRQVQCGAIPDAVTLEAELRALGVNGAVASELRALFPTEKEAA